MNVSQIQEVRRGSPEESALAHLNEVDERLANCKSEVQAQKLRKRRKGLLKDLTRKGILAQN